MAFGRRAHLPGHACCRLDDDRAIYTDCGAREKTRSVLSQVGAVRLSRIDDVRQKKKGKTAPRAAVTCRARLSRWLPTWSSRATLGPLGAEPTFIPAQSTMRRRQLLHNPGKFISARPPASLPLRGLDREPSGSSAAAPPFGWTGVTATARRVVSTCRKPAGGQGPPAGTGTARLPAQLHSAPEIFLLARNDNGSTTVNAACSFRPYVMDEGLAQPTGSDSVTSPFWLRFAASSLFGCAKGRRWKGDGKRMNE